MENGYKGWVYTSYVFKFTYINNTNKYRKKIKNRFMTPQEKAKELVDKMYGVTDYQAKQSALIAVDEILDEIQPFELAWEYESKIKFWESVKKEIEKL